MRDGLKVLQLPGRYGYSVTKVGWIRRAGGDEWELLPGSVSVFRTQGRATLDQLASRGLGDDHGATEPAKLGEDLHRLVIRRSLPADEKAWLKLVPKPKGWKDE